ncbi:Cof-type HAD-IIB family hydrolase [uncultured Bacteroides sp.]|uniref:Cof-type HAD-IIB family hydrolase n=1 Tax=uncultured Bacteroides sp. TaxID=162156 RepID=UPI002AAC3FF5|nr:Cof-type HAD-IIB family hydrolase [uncultured Bacteroides sp.]
MIKALFLDIDGTLVSFKTHAIPQSTIKALEILRNKGIKLYISTGRPRAAINNLGDLRFDGYITMNGSYCYGDDKDEVVYKSPIPSEDVNTLLDILSVEKDCPCVIVREHNMFICNPNEKMDEFIEMLKFPRVPAISIEEARKEEVFQLSPFFSLEQEEKYLPLMTHCESSRWYPSFTDIVRKGNSKQLGMDKILEYLGISLDETMAFGDGGNDISMLRHAHIGIAMGNANQEVKNSADYVTDSIDDDGLWNALKHYNLI